LSFSTTWTGLIGQGARDRLADPPGRVGGELEALAIVELLGRTYQPERSLLNQVEEGQALVAVVLGDRDDEAEVGLDHLLLGVEVAALDPLGQVDLLLCGQQADLADVLEEQLQGVGRHVRLEVQRRLRLAAAALVGSALDLGGGERRIDLLDELDLSPLEEAVQLLDVSLVEIQLGYRSGDFGVREHSELLAPVDESLDLLEFLQFRYRHLVPFRPCAGTGARVSAIRSRPPRGARPLLKHTAQCNYYIF
jgi:hypothetical protein